MKNLTERIEQRIEEYPAHGNVGADWVRGPLRDILHHHPEHAGSCRTCMAFDSASRLRLLPERYPCPTVRVVMDAVALDAWENAFTVLDALLDDVAATGAPRPLTVLREAEKDITGWFAFGLVYPERRRPVYVPGVELAHVRPGPDGRIAGLDRIEVEGCAWAWPFAVQTLAEEAR